MTDKEKYETLVAEIKRLNDETAIGLNEWENGVENGRMEVINALNEKISSMQEEPVSEDLEEAAEAWSNNDDNTGSCDYIGATVCNHAFKAGAKWQKQQIKKSMDLGEPPYLISVEQAYYRTLKLLED